MKRLIRFCSVPIVVIALEVSIAAVPAGAATRATTAQRASENPTAFVAAIASLQNQTVPLSNGDTCTVNGRTCVVTGSDQKLTLFPAISLPHMPLAEAASLTVAITGAATSIGEVISWTIIICLL